MELKPAYKNTEVGVIPEEWDVKTLGELGSFKNGINKDKDDFGHGKPFVNLMDVFGIPKISQNVDFGLVNSSATERKLYELKSGDLLFVRSSVKPSGVGLTTLVENDLPDTVFSGFLIRYRDNGKLFFEFKKHCFWEAKFRSRLIASSTVSANTNINQDALKALRLALPNDKDEQRAISTALSDVDALLNGLDQLISKRRDIKQAAMQQLLTGKQRLPGFDQAGTKSKQSSMGQIPEDWQLKTLDELGSWKGGITPSMRNPLFWLGGNVPWASSGDVKMPLLSDTQSKITNAAVKQSAAVLLPPGCILVVTRSGILRRYLPVSKNIRPMAINQDIKALIPNGQVFTDFLLHLLIFNGPKILASCLKSGTTVESIEYPWLKKYEVAVPPIAEQTALAIFLSDMDADLTALELRREKTRMLKQGMMQELLTGRIRLV
jgi:type I restriction enzyme S subunit